MSNKLIAAGLWLAICSISIQAETVYFLVACPDPNHPADSYVLPLTDYIDIDHARLLVQFGPAIGQPLVVAYIACGPDGINRDFLSPTKHIWNWHVIEFLGFADITAEILDGNPTFVEEGCSGLPQNTVGEIGFWSYTVIDELGEDELSAFCNYNINHDNQINLTDFAILAVHWLNSDCIDPTWCDYADLNQDGTVDLSDLSLYVDVWLSPYAVCQP